MIAARMSTRLVGAVALAVIGFLIIVMFSGLFRKPFEGGKRTLVADFERAAQLHPGDQVRLEGNIEGEVTGVEPAPGGDETRVTMEVDEDAGPIFADAGARLRMKTLLGGAFYIEIDRGSERLGELGDRVISSDRTVVQVELEDVTDVFRGEAITGFKTLPGEAAEALADAEHPAAALRMLGEIAPDAEEALRAVRGRDPGEDLPELIDATATTVRALDAPNDELQKVVSAASATVLVTGRRSNEIRQLIARGPAVTDQLTHTLARLDGTLDNVRGLVGRLDPAVPAIEPTLVALRPTLERTSKVLNDAEPLARLLGPTLSWLGRLGAAGRPLVERAKPSLVRTGDTILPYLSRKDPVTGKPTTVMIGGTAAGFGGAAGQQDGNGHFIRFPASGSASSVSLPCSSSLINPSVTDQLACDTLDTALENYLNYLPPVLPESQP